VLRAKGKDTGEIRTLRVGLSADKESTEVTLKEV